MPLFARNEEAEVVEVDIDKADDYGIFVTCKTLPQAVEIFKTLDSTSPGGKGLLERLTEIPYER